MNKIFACVAALLILAACENMGNLYPVNADAYSSVGTAAHFTWAGTGTGQLEVVMPNGEVLSGKFGPPYGNATFGDTFKAVYGQFSSLPDSPNKGTPTVAMLTGNKGSSMRCEFYNDDYSDHGFGGCKTGSGALYRLKY